MCCKLVLIYRVLWVILRLLANILGLELFHHVLQLHLDVFFNQLLFQIIRLKMFLDGGNNLRTIPHGHIRPHLHSRVLRKWILSEMRHVVRTGYILRQQVSFSNLRKLLKSKLLFHLELVTVLGELILILECFLG